MTRLQTSSPAPTCSFCGKTRAKVAQLIAGAGVFICNECVELCADMLETSEKPPSPEGMEPSTVTVPSSKTLVPEDPPKRTAARLPQLVLASSSVSRLRVLRDAGFDPVVVVSGVSEDFGDLSPTQAVVAIAERKASAVAIGRHESLVIGCDSMLDVDGEALGKPASAAEAREMWGRLSGRQAILHTGHCLIDTKAGRRVTRLASSMVQFGTPSDSELSAYVATPAPLALAGAFSIEGLSGPFVRTIQGSPSNVLGMSLPDFREMLSKLGVQITDLWRSAWRAEAPTWSEGS